MLFQIWGYYKEFCYELGEGNGNPLQYSCLENPMDGGAWWATVCGFAKTWTQLSDFTSFLSFFLLWTIFKVFPCAHMKCLYQTSLLVQWIRIHLPGQGTWVQSLVLEDSTCCGATKPLSRSYGARVLHLLKLACLQPVPHNKRSYRKEKPTHDQDE